ncbi:MAG: DUF4373 domain-containing protein [Bacteroides sp.]|nr:DUF4373 domain-containing protein [Bacteroides sp.]
MKDTFYFKHDCNARTDPKLQEVLIDLGAEGLGIYWCIIEQLYEQGGRLPLRSCKCIAFALHVQCNAVEQLIGNYGLFQNNGEFFWSDSVLKRMNERDKSSEKRKSAALARWGKKTENIENQSQEDLPEYKCNASAMQVHSKADAMQCYKIRGDKIIEDIKENTTKEKKSVERFSPPALEEVKAYVSQQGYSFAAENFYDFYESKGWYVGKNKMKDWRAAVRNWARGEKERFARRATAQQTKKVNTEWEQ